MDRFNLVVSLHPKMKFKNYEFLEKNFPLKLISENLSEFLPLASVYVSHFNSSTVM